MYIKVTLPGQDPKIYSLSKAEVLIGSSTICHIIVNHPSISKKHAKLIREDASWFVVDQGSTNGTYLDSEQLVPGKRLEIKPLQELRLGDKVTLELMEIAQKSHELNEPTSAASTPIASTVSSEQDKTRVISLADLQKAKEETLKLKQREKKKANLQLKKQKQKENKKISLIIIVSAILILVGFAGSVWWRKNRDKQMKRETVMKKVTTKLRSDDEIDKDVEAFRIRRTALISRNRIIDIFNTTKKCEQQQVVELCLMGKLAERENGAVFVEPNQYVFFYNEDSLLPSTVATYLRTPPIDQESARKLTFLTLLDTELKPEGFNSDTNLYVTFYRIDEMGKKRISSIQALSMSSYVLLLEDYRKVNFLDAEIDLKKELKKLESFYTFY